jgi:hypothetical protein
VFVVPSGTDAVPGGSHTVAAIQSLLTITEALGVIGGFGASLQGCVKVDGTFA